jgi:class 3 adenylate cyclase/pimeloyl-ACP methyl ester carboxylesterase
MEREIRFCTTEDGVRIAYCVEGEGPALVCCPDFVGSFALDPLIDDQMAFWRGLWGGRRVVRYDMRGTGLSDRDVADLSHEALVRDLRAVVQASGLTEMVLWASTLSGPRAIELAARSEGLVRRLILHRTFARARDLMSAERVRSFAELARLNWATAAQVFADLPVRQDLPAAGVHQAQLYAQSTSGELVARLLTQGLETTDVTALLPALRMPVMVLHRVDDPMFAFRLAQGLAAAIPGARLNPLPQGIMTYVAQGRIGEIHALLNGFIDDGAGTSVVHGADPDVSHGVRTILFTDLVEHTRMMRRLGDARGRDVLREHERVTREMLHSHGGVEIKGTGDGLMASFASVTRAVDCAVALQRAVADLNAGAVDEMQLRIGLNAGEPIEDGGDLFGSMVIMASRIAAEAHGGEILIPEPVRHLLAGKQYEYADRGEFLPKGFEDRVRLFEVRWRQ